MQCNDRTGHRVSLKSLAELLWISLRLGLTSFGGPIAHLAYFRDEYVTRRRWLDEKCYADLVALCQFLPGPASSQISMAIGIIRSGLWGGIVSWLGFTLPSAFALVFFSYTLQDQSLAQTGWLQGLTIVAVAVVAHAVWGMAKNLTPDRTRITIAFVTAVIVLLFPLAQSQIILIVLAGIYGWLFFPRAGIPEHTFIKVPISRAAASLAWITLLALLLLLPLVSLRSGIQLLAIFDSFYRVGSLVFGGGHVVLPLLQAEVVPPGWVTDAQFIAGYGAAQAVPGPLFTFASYLGMVMAGWKGALAATVAIFLPSFLLITGGLPLWDNIRKHPAFQASLNCINAAVVGILLAALYNPVWVKAIKTPGDFAIALTGFGMLMFWKAPPWIVVIFCVLARTLLDVVMA